MFVDVRGKNVALHLLPDYAEMEVIAPDYHDNPSKARPRNRASTCCHKHLNASLQQKFSTSNGLLIMAFQEKFSLQSKTIFRAMVPFVEIDCQSIGVLGDLKHCTGQREKPKSRPSYCSETETIPHQRPSLKYGQDLFIANTERRQEYRPFTGD